MTERGTTGAEEPQMLEFLDFITTSSGMDVAPMKATCALVKPGFATWNSIVDVTSNDPLQYGDGRGEVIPTFDEADFCQCERRVRLFVSNTRVALEKRAGKLLERLEARAFEAVGGNTGLGNTKWC